MRLYTRTGDDGTTGLLGGQRVGKDALRVEACGQVDELNATIGLAACVCHHALLVDMLREIQARLFELGADLANPQGEAGQSAKTASRFPPQPIADAEQRIDQLCEVVPPMRHFILPGGSELASRLHLARTVCRRVERVCVALHKQQAINPHIMVYLNRLSDLLFAMARRANQLEGVEDVPWITG